MSPRERRMVPDARPADYYGRPVIKPPVWTKEIPWYFWAGGLAGAAAPLAGGARATGNDVLARRATAIALAGAGVSPVLLISDLGRPARFFNMLRVFKVTSPMSVGSWVLSGFGTATALSAGWQVAGIIPAALGAPAAAASAFLGPWLSTYTAVLIANTAVPAWHEARHVLPFVFAGSSLASAGGACAALTPVRAAAPARAMGAAGAALALGATVAMERSLDARVRASFEEPAVKRLQRAGQACTAAGAALLALGGRRSRVAAVAGGAALAAGAACERWAIFKAGTVSAKDPQQTVAPQKERAAASGRQPVQRAPVAAG